jgi:tRNA (adenine22-N1)-methyltransferase
MGGMLMLEILSADMGKTLSFKQLLLSPQRDLMKVKAFLSANGLNIHNEISVTDGGKTYDILEIRIY